MRSPTPISAKLASKPHRLSWQNDKWTSGDFLLIVALSLLFAALAGFWFYWDHHFPSQDEAGHIMNSFAYRDLLRTCKVFRSSWWFDFFTVNRCYPPIIYIFNGFLKLLLGSGRFVDVISITLFTVLLTASVYTTVRLLKGNKIAAVFAAVVINLYPEISCLNHTFLLDLPLVSMVSLGIMSMVAWSKSPSWQRATACGLILGLACLSKQLAAAYLLPMGLFFLSKNLVALANANKNRKKELLQLVCIALIAAAISFPWLAINLSSIQHIAHYSQSLLDVNQTRNLAGLTLFAHYLTGFPYMMSPLLFALFILAVSVSSLTTHKLLAPAAISACGGVALLSLWVCIPCDRYIAPALLLPAIYSGYAAEWAVHKAVLAGKRLMLGCFAVIIALAILQYLSFNFCPYPFVNLRFLSPLSENLGVKLRDENGLFLTKNNPYVKQDWGHSLVIKTIENVEGDKPVWLNILANCPDINAHSFELLAQEAGSKIKPTTSRIWTILGDRVFFSPTTAMHYQWYLLKTDNTGFCFYDRQSKQNLRALENFVQFSGKFKLMAKKALPDKSLLLLYKHYVY